jgi:serine protease Do
MLTHAQPDHFFVPHHHIGAMASFSSRARWAIAIIVAFGGGLLFASNMHWTRLGFAQSKPSLSDVRPIADASNAFVSIADHATPAVVSIQVDSKFKGRSQRMAIPRGMLPPGFEDFGFGQPEPQFQEASGSGFIVSEDGYILTNNHVVTGPDRRTVADKITVQLLDHRSFPARVIGTDPTTDVAVIKIEGKDLPTIPLGDDNTSRVGEWVLAIGNPLGLDFTVTAGIISAKGRSLTGLNTEQYSVTDLIQTDAAINPGNSGGPLVNARGEVIGINSAIASQTGYYAGYGFAIPISLAKRVMDQIIKTGKVRIGILGVAISEVDAGDAAVAGLSSIHGARVQAFQPDTPDNAARKAGLQPNDVIITVDGQTVDRVSTLQRAVRNHAPGETVKLEVMRYGKKLNFSVKLMDRPAETQTAANTASDKGPQGKLGVQLGPLPARSAVPAGFPSRGVMITAVDGLGPANNKLFRNDVITDILYPKSVAGQVNSASDLQAALDKLKAGDYVSLKVSSYTQQGTVSRVVNLQLEK